jgi:hypothetical protein
MIGRQPVARFDVLCGEVTTDSRGGAKARVWRTAVPELAAKSEQRPVTSFELVSIDMERKRKSLQSLCRFTFRPRKSFGVL